MRMPPRTQTGNIGTSGVTNAFERLNWGAAGNDRHDVGTDLLVMPRDERGVELCLLVGVQVKTRGVGEGPGKYFSEPEKAADSDEPAGWWFRDPDRRHVDSWLRYDVPHLLVLHDANTGISYWVHVTDDAVVPTGKGAKILVPASQTIDPEHREQLLSVAATQRPRVEWEGSAWRGPESVPPAALLRHALIVPRLVAPHPNRTPPEPLAPEQAVALLVRVQLNDLKHRLHMGAFDTDLSAALDRPGWCWSFARALLRRLITGEGDDLRATLETADGPVERTAATVAAAATLIEEGEVEHAADLVQRTLEHDDAHPVDHAWLSLQRARCLRDLGREDEARECALVTQRVRTAFPDDLTASAIGGIGAMTLYRLSEWDIESNLDKLADGVSGLDTTAVWWRALDTGDGLRDSANRAFKAWARDSAITWRTRDTAADDLLATSLMAGFLGDHGAWASLTTLFATENLRRLDRTSEPEHVRSALETLRLCGDHKSLKLAVRRVVHDGPATAAAAAAAGCDLDSTTRTTARASLLLLREAGDLLDRASADRTCAWLIDTLEDPTAFVACTRPTYLLLTELVDTAAGVVAACSPDLQRRVAELVAQLPAEQDDLHARSWARLARAVPQQCWSADIAAAFVANAASHHEVLLATAHEVAAQHDAEHRAALLPLLGQGSQHALSAFGDVRDLPAETVIAYLEHLVTACARIRDQAKNSSRSVGGADHPGDLALLNAWHPEQAQWGPLLDLLADPLVWPNDKTRALTDLVRLCDRVPADVAQRLRDIAEHLLIATPPRVAGLFGDVEDPGGAALNVAYGLADPAHPIPSHWRAQLLDLVRGDREGRRWAAYIARHEAELAGSGLLAALVYDDDPLVRAEAVASLLHRASSDATSHALGQVALERAVEDPGTVVPQNLANALATADGVTEEMRTQHLRRLAQHQSATVRLRAERALERRA